MLREQMEADKEHVSPCGSLSGEASRPVLGLVARVRGPGASAGIPQGWPWVEGAAVSGRHELPQPRSLFQEGFDVPVSAAPRPGSVFLAQKPAGGQACPFTAAQAHHSYCFKKNFLALSLKLNCPLRVSYFVCSCLFGGGTTLPSLPPPRREC